MGAWYESLESQLKWKHYNKLIKIVLPNSSDWKMLAIRPKFKPKPNNRSKE